MTAFFCRRVIKFDQLIARIGAEVCQDDLLARNWTFPSFAFANLIKDKLPEVWQSHLCECTESLEQIRAT
ncbi:hypothetical protein CWO17_22835 [Vibrio sp. 10N.286.45.A3]|nr:hypothetical protein BCU34_13875 [Vibrio sp. 10N.286.45.E10]PTO96073.1 hypothetical protein CWO17_22835 [Vibrio sp. 10N.286.45.A3]PTQ21008.1 hypothetical protein CWO24_22090 [Vibrio sp. 10N.286.46.E10]